MKRSLRVAKILGIPIEINYTWLIIFGLITWTLAQGYFPYTLPGKTSSVYWTMGIFAALLLFGSLLLHELSHSYVAKRYGIPIRGITLFIFGGVAQMGKEPQSPKVEFWMAVAGPVCSISISIISTLVANFLAVLGTMLPLIVILKYVALLNLIVAIFNLVPGFPLDGGRILRSLLWAWLKDIRKATAIASGFGKGFAYFLMAVGFAFLFTGAFINGIWFIFIGLFLQEAATTSYRQVALKKALAGIKVHEIMSREVVTIDSEIPLDKLVNDYFFKHRYTSFPVLTFGNLVGIISLDQVKTIPHEKWATTKVGEVMITLRSNLLAHPDDDLSGVLSQIATNEVGRILIVEDHVLAGILSKRDIMRLFEIKEDLGE